MSNVSGVKPQTALPPIAPPKVGGDADGDNDGSKGGARPTAPVVSKPTQTLGNRVNTTA